MTLPLCPNPPEEYKPTPETIPTPPLRALAETIAAEVRLPTVIADRCVHSHINDARCRACADACPLNAWVIDDERLGIDINACDGCGLCVPACPENAITCDHALADTDIRSWKGHTALFRACERTDLDAADCRIPCLHSIGTRELLHQYRRGMATWITTTADCDACPRGRSQRLSESVEKTNTLLQSRNLEPIALVALEPAQWQKILKQSTPCQSGPVSTRRNFFRDALRTAVNTTRDAAALAGDEPASLTPPTAWLAETGPDDLFLATPNIDPTRCNGCDACVRLCPHQAIRLETTDSEPCYQIEAQHCTGCGICRDACDQNAIHLAALALRPQAVALAQGHCPACNIRYHLPTGQLRPDGLCTICARTRHGRQLYQVLR
ncbi:MAG: 4Fe-4S binding protein [Candidatus Competibacter denitrificans]